MCACVCHASVCVVQEGKLAASEELGDLFKSASDWDTAQAIYQQAGASGKVVEALAAKGDFEQLVRVSGSGRWMGVPWVVSGAWYCCLLEGRASRRCAYLTACMLPTGQFLLV